MLLSSVSVVIPALNEERNIPHVLARIPKDAHQVILVDGDSADNTVEVYPLLPENTWNWFCLDDVKYHGHSLTIIWDKDGTRYGRGKGLIVLADGIEIARGDKLAKLTGKLP